MIPTLAQLKSISQMPQGSLEEIPFAVLLHALAVHRQTVVLEIERSPLSKTIIIEHGNPIDCRSNLMHETLSRFLASRGTLGEEESQTYFNRSAELGIPLGELLTREGKISATDLFKALQQNLAKKLLDVFSWRSGEFRMHSDVPAADSSLKVNAPQLVITGISKFALAEEVNEAIGPLVGKRLVLHPSPPFPLQDLHLTKEQRKLLDFLGEGKRIDELAAEASVPFERIMRWLYSMAVLGVVTDEEQRQSLEARAAKNVQSESPRPRPPRAKPLAPPPVDRRHDRRHESAPAMTSGESGTTAVPMAGTATDSGTTADRGEMSAARFETAKVDTVSIDTKTRDHEHNRLMEAYLGYRKQDAFELLDLEDTASAEEIERKYLAFSQRFAPWKFDVSGLSNLAEKAEDLFLAGGRAFGELCDVERRNALIQRRQTLQQGTKAPTRDRFMIKSKLLDPAVQFRKGKALKKKMLYREAAQQLQFAVDCDPQNSQYRSELAFCKYLDSPEREAQDVLQDLEETLRLDPKCGMAVFYSGQILGDLEQYEDAEDKLRLAIKMMMPDRRPIEALKALQAHQNSKKKRRFL